MPVAACSASMRGAVEDCDLHSRRPGSHGRSRSARAGVSGTEWMGSGGGVDRNGSDRLSTPHTSHAARPSAADATCDHADHSTSFMTPLPRPCTPLPAVIVIVVPLLLYPHGGDESTPHCGGFVSCRRSRVAGHSGSIRFGSTRVRSFAATRPDAQMRARSAPPRMSPTNGVTDTCDRVVIAEWPHRDGTAQLSCSATSPVESACRISAGHGTTNTTTTHQRESHEQRDSEYRAH
jgi:hypothetical protein